MNRKYICDRLCVKELFTGIKVQEFRPDLAKWDKVAVVIGTKEKSRFVNGSYRITVGRWSNGRQRLAVFLQTSQEPCHAIVQAIRFFNKTHMSGVF